VPCYLLPDRFMYAGYHGASAVEKSAMLPLGYDAVFGVYSSRYPHFSYSGKN